MSTITIDDIDYAADSLSNEAKAELASMQACDEKMAALQKDYAITQTARSAYAFALKGLLPEATPKAKTKPKPKPKPKAKAKKV